MTKLKPLWIAGLIIAAGCVWCACITTDQSLPPTSPTPSPVTTIGKDGKEMVLVPAGEFLMGTSDAQIEDFLQTHPDWKREWLGIEQPQHRVYLDAFYIDKTEVTNAEYKRFVEATGHKPPPHWQDGQIPAGQENYPVTHIHQPDDAQAYAAWASKRLPTEAEWEKAARGTDGRIYPWGNDWDPEKANVLGSEWNGPAPVGTYGPAGASPYGALDMAGNVWEWCSDWYAADYYLGSPLRNPQGPSEGRHHVVRGGSWFDPPEYARCAFRYGLYPRRLFTNQGFRCVQEL
jgi:iron(II)-dependent oxidoreductase